MTNYQESTISASGYQRCNRITIENPYGKAPSIFFGEERIIKLGDTSASQPLKGIPKIFSDPAETFDIYNPVTQAKTGATATLGQIYALIWSVYMNEATKRDAAP